MSSFKILKSYDEALAEVSTWADSCGTKIDAAMLPIIARFHMLGIPTLSSCEGHGEQEFGHPHVVIGFEPDLETEATDEAWHAYYMKNMRVHKRLFDALEQFYKVYPETEYHAQIKLNLWQGGFAELITNGGSFCLFSKNKANLKELYLSEINKFSEFLLKVSKH